LKEKWIVQDKQLKAFKKMPGEGDISISERQSTDASPVVSLEPVLEISQRRSDRIIFLRKEVKITSRGFSLLYFLAQHKQEVVSYNSILDEIWEDDEDAIYTRIISHVYKFRRNILDAIGHNEDNTEKVKDIFKVISGRGVMLNISDEELQIN
ncbi:unnamed protein product, partial [marine sediment metagenome]